MTKRRRAKVMERVTETEMAAAATKTLVKVAKVAMKAQQTLKQQPGEEVESRVVEFGEADKVPKQR